MDVHARSSSHLSKLKFVQLRFTRSILIENWFELLEERLHAFPRGGATVEHLRRVAMPNPAD
jgi:hypothetical protein